MVVPLGIPHSRPCLGVEEQEAASRVVASQHLAQGPEVEAFEHELGQFLGVPHVVALANGTAALHLSLLFRGAAPGKNVILPSYSCVSLLNAVAYTGAEARLVDSLPNSPDMDLGLASQASDSQTVAVVLPHLLGRAVALPSATNKKNLIEDATQSLGARDGRHKVGTRGLAGVFSFYATKMIAGGEAGALVCRKTRLEHFCRDRRDYDFRPDWKVRYNYKMSDLTAAILRVQLRRLPAFLERRRQLASFYSNELAGLSRARLLAATPGDAHYRFVLSVSSPVDSLIERLQGSGLAVRRPVFRPIHHYLKQPHSHFPHAQSWWRHCISIPLYPALRDEEAERVVRLLKQELA